MFTYLQNILIYVIKKGGVILKVVQTRLPDDIIEWIGQMANKEGVALSTMLRIYLIREKYREDIEKQFGKKKRGK